MSDKVPTVETVIAAAAVVASAKQTGAEPWLVEFPARGDDFMPISFLTFDYLIPPDGKTTGYRLSGYLSACGTGRFKA